MTHYPIIHFHQPARGGLEFPSQLWQIPQPPKSIYVQGSLKALETLEKLPEKGIAIVGTRLPQSRSVAFTQNLIRDLADTDLIVVSGLARGIDTVAHLQALESGLTTVAILGSGVSVDYPRENGELKERILSSDGLLISEFPPSAQPKGFHFIRRNRLIAGWSKVTCVIEAGQRSGALNTASWARDQNKTCFAVPGYPSDPALAGNQTLLDRDHALPLWGVHSLGAAWLELSTKTRIAHMAKKGNLDPKIQLLIKQVTLWTGQQGGVQWQDLFNWSVSQGWTVEEYYRALEHCLESKWMRNDRGTLLIH